MSNDKRGLALGIGLAVLRPLLTLLTKRDWRGQEHLPPRGGCVLAVNHVSEVDPLVVGHFVYANGRLPRFLGKVEVFKVPILGRILLSAGQIPVDRRSSDAAKAYAAAVAALEAGRCLIFYPEGTLTRQPDLWPMAGKSGAARIALATGCPLIPMAQWGPQDLLSPYARRLRLFPRKVMHVAAGPPIDFSDLVTDPITPAALQLATTRVMDAITSLLEEIRGEKAPDVRFDLKTQRVSRIGKLKDSPGDEQRPDL